MEKIRVGLYCFGKNHAIDKYFQILRLFDKMIKDQRYETVILVDGTGIAEKDLRDLYKDREVKFVDIRKYNINSLGLNFVMIIDPYNKPYSSSNETDAYSQIKVPIVYKEYGTAGVELNSGYLINKKVYKYADLIITENNYMKDKILNKYKDKKEDQVIVGSPAFDYVYDKEVGDKRFDDKFYHVLWTPHHSIVKNGGYDKIVGGTYSTFLSYKDYFANEFLSYFNNTVLHLKPHPLLRGRYNHAVGKFKDYLNSFSGPDRFYVHEKEDYHNLFMKTDLIINDSISFVQEWLPTCKPMIILEDENKAKYSPYGEELVSFCYYRARTPEEVTKLVEILKVSDPKYKERRRFLNSLLISPGTPNSSSLLDFLYNRYKN